MPRFARCVFAVFLAVSCLTSSLTCQAAAPETAAAAFILMEAGSGRVLSSRNETQERSIASTTKIMTCLIALEHSELTEKVTVKREHLREGSSMYLLEGETLTMEELLYGLMLPSADADLKIYLTASAEERARRRCLELSERGTPKAYEEVLREINERDYQDMHRDIAPLREAADAVHFDTSKLSFEESEQALLNLIQEKLK